MTLHNANTPRTVLLNVSISFLVVATRFVRKLDHRYSKEQKARRLKCKMRTDGSPSQLSLMKGPAWAIDARFSTAAECPLPEAEEQPDSEEDNEGAGVEEDDDMSEDSDIFNEH